MVNEKTTDSMMPRVGEKLDEYTARHLGVEIQHFRDMKDNIREDRYGDKLGGLAFEYRSWKDGIRSRLRVPPNSSDQTIEQVIRPFNPTRLPKDGPKALEPLPGQMELPIPPGDAAIPVEPTKKTRKRRRT